jgi:hypothetical protein
MAALVISSVRRVVVFVAEPRLAASLFRGLRLREANEMTPDSALDGPLVTRLTSWPARRKEKRETRARGSLRPSFGAIRQISTVQS